MINTKINAIFAHDLRSQLFNAFEEVTVSSACYDCNMTLEGIEEPEEEG